MVQVLAPGTAQIKNHQQQVQAAKASCRAEIAACVNSNLNALLLL
jgi:hypothetical protein